MKTCETLNEAQAVPGVKHIHFEDGKPVAYVEGDDLPEDALPKPNPVLDQIVSLEAGVTQRMLREAALGIAEGKARLKTIDDAIAALRAQLP